MKKSSEIQHLDFCCLEFLELSNRYLENVRTSAVALSWAETNIILILFYDISIM